MFKFTTEQLSSIIALPLIIILLFWTVAIFHKNRKKWGPYDIPIVSILVLSILRNLTILIYILTILCNFNEFDTEYCSVITWTFNSIHTFQASSLTSIAVIGLFSTKLHLKSQNLKTFLTPTHIIYHLFCLTTLCACVGVAAILAQKNGGINSTVNIFSNNFNFSPCSFLPFELDIKFNVFIIVLHVFLAIISLICFLIICVNYYKIKKEGFDYIKKSNSDLSDLSNSNFHGINMNVNENRNHYYDTYTINRNDSNSHHYCNTNHKDTWPPISNNSFNNHHSEVLSNNSTTVSSTNSRKPCLIKHHHHHYHSQQQQQTQQQQQQQQQHQHQQMHQHDDIDDEDEIEIRRTGLETIHPVLIVCYLFYHLPLIVLCVYPKLIYPWPVGGVALWLGLIQDLLIPVGLGIVDSRFCQWVSNVYKSSNKRRTEEKLPQVGLDGKFRPFGLGSPPQSLDINHSDRSKTLIEHRFPITNGSLYTSIDGRLPVIHNYRRHKEFRTGTLRLQQDLLQSSNMALHSTHLSRRTTDLDSTPSSENYTNCSNCEEDQCPSHSDLHHLSPEYISRKLSYLQVSQNNVFSTNGERISLGRGNGMVKIHHDNNENQRRMICPNPQEIIDQERQRNLINYETFQKSQSHESINRLFGNGMMDNDFHHHSSEMNIANSKHNESKRRKSRNAMRLNKMRLSRSEESLSDIQFEIEVIRDQQKIVPIINHHRHKHQQTSNIHHHGYSSDDEDYSFPHSNVNPLLINTKDYDSISSNNSITTEANCDFEFFQTTNNNNSNELYGKVPQTSNFIISESRMNVNNMKNQTKPPPQLPSIPPPPQKHHISNTRITRSNSKRSLESFHAFIEETSAIENQLHENNVSRVTILPSRSNSFSTLDEKKIGTKRKAKQILRTNSRTSVNSIQFQNDNERNYCLKQIINKKIKSVEYLPDNGNSNSSINNNNIHNNGNVYIENMRNYRNQNDLVYVTSSVPDFKKVFISEYI